MAQLVESGRYDWVWTVGCDTLITNLTIALESIIATAEDARGGGRAAAGLPRAHRSLRLPARPQLEAQRRAAHRAAKHLLICGERATAVQADSFLVRGSEEGSAYLRDILAQYEIYKHHGWVEDQAMIDLRDKHAAITRIVPQWMMNSYDYSRFYHAHPVYGRDGLLREPGAMGAGGFPHPLAGGNAGRAAGIPEPVLAADCDMRVAILYLKIIRRIEAYPIATPYELGHKRFYDGYRKFMPVIPHDLIIVRCGATEGATDFDAIATHYLRFDGWGGDCAAYQEVVRVLDYDLVLCLNTLAYPYRHRWLEPFVEAMEVHGKGVYGATASYEVAPHLRTPAIAFHPDLIREYPFSVKNRGDSNLFEAGGNSIAAWAQRTGYPAVLVAADGRLPARRLAQARQHLPARRPEQLA